MADRAHREWTTYQRSARELDTRFYAPPQTPVHDRLLSFGQVRCLVFGAYGEASPDVHHCITAAATRRAQRSWRHLGARSQHEARAFFLQSYRRDVGMAVVREHARLRLARVPFVGVPRDVVQARGVQRRREQVRGTDAAGGRADQFFAHQARGAVVARAA